MKSLKKCTNDYYVVHYIPFVPCSILEKKDKWWEEEECKEKKHDRMKRKKNARTRKRENAQMCANTSNSHDSPIKLHAMMIKDIKESH